MTIDYEPVQKFEAMGLTVPYPDDPFELHNGPFYCGKNAEGNTVVTLEVGRTQCNSNLLVHGGCLMTLADLAVCYEAIDGDPEMRSVTVSLTANFLSPVDEGATLYAYPCVNRRTKRMAFVDVRIIDGEVVIFTGSAVIRVMPR